MFSLRGVACSEHSAHPWLLFTHVCVRRQHLVLDSGRVGEGGRPDEEKRWEGRLLRGNRNEMMGEKGGGTWRSYGGTRTDGYLKKRQLDFPSTKGSH